MAVVNALVQLSDGLTSVETALTQRLLRSHLQCPASGTTPTAATAYFVYLGLVVLPITPKFLRVHRSGAGSGTQTVEMGFFSTPAAPTYATNQSLTKLVATGSCSDFTAAASISQNSSAFATLIPAGTHLWGGIRISMSGSPPTLQGLINDFSMGAILNVGSAAVLTGAGPWAGVVPVLAANTWLAPCLFGTLD